MTNNIETVYEGKFIEVVSDNGWEFVRRRNTTGVVAIVPITSENEIVLVEQFRPPVGKRVVEIPAGLAGDVAGSEDEDLVKAAQRELAEETGYEAGDWKDHGSGPSSAGLTDELITFFSATGLMKTGDGGGDATENIEVHVVPLQDLRSWLQERASEDRLIDPKIAAGLWMAGILA
jgi:ADP-ribose pyrophosphatase